MESTTFTRLIFEELFLVQPFFSQNKKKKHQATKEKEKEEQNTKRYHKELQRKQKKTNNMEDVPLSQWKSNGNGTSKYDAHHEKQLERKSLLTQLESKHRELERQMRVLRQCIWLNERHPLYVPKQGSDYKTVFRGCAHMISLDDLEESTNREKDIVPGWMCPLNDLPQEIIHLFVSTPNYNDPNMDYYAVYRITTELNPFMVDSFLYDLWQRLIQRSRVFFVRNRSRFLEWMQGCRFDLSLVNMEEDESSSESEGPWVAFVHWESIETLVQSKHDEEKETGWAPLSFLLISYFQQPLDDVLRWSPSSWTTYQWSTRNQPQKQCTRYLVPKQHKDTFYIAVLDWFDQHNLKPQDMTCTILDSKWTTTFADGEEKDLIQYEILDSNHDSFSDDFHAITSAFQPYHLLQPNRYHYVALFIRPTPSTDDQEKEDFKLLQTSSTLTSNSSSRSS